MKVFTRMLATGLVLGLLTSITSARASNMSDQPPPREMTDQQLVAAINGLRGNNDLETACQRLPYTSEMARRHPGRQTQAVAAFDSGVCDLIENRDEEGLAELDRTEQLAPAELLKSIAPTLDRLGMLAAARKWNAEGFLEHAGRIARRDDSEEFAALNPGVVRFGLYRMDAQHAGLLALAFARAGSFSHLPDDLQQVVADRGIPAALAVEDVGLAGRLAALQRDPRSLRNMLLDRQFARIWPQLAEHVGPHMKAALEFNVAATRAAADAAPDDLTKLSAEVEALGMAGQDAEAVAEAAKVDHSDAGLSKIGEQGAWVLNADIGPLDALGRQAEADAIFDGIARLDPEGRSWLVSFVINRADRLVNQGRWSEALPAAEQAVSLAVATGSPYAVEAAASLRLCAAHHVDPERDLTAWMQDIDKGSENGVFAATRAALCIGDEAAAVRYLKAGLANVDQRSLALMALQPDRASFGTAGPKSVLRDPRELLKDHPDLKAAYVQYGRDLPDDLLPQVEAAPQNSSVSR